MKKSIGTIIPICILVILAVAGGAVAGDVRDKEVSYGFKAGMVSPGIWYVGDREFEPDAGYTLGGFLDYKLGPKISGGLALDMHQLNAYEETGQIIDLGITLKALIYGANSRFVFRPGFGMGYGMLGDMGPFDASTYFLLKGDLEMIVLTSSSFSWLVDIGIIGAPTGGNDDADMSFDVGMTFRAGLVF